MKNSEIYLILNVINELFFANSFDIVFLNIEHYNKNNIIKKEKLFNHFEISDFSANNWSFYQDYLKTGLKCQTVAECLEFLDETIGKVGKKFRAPHLARLDLFKRARDCEFECSLDLVEDMLKYFNQFGSKGCVVSDLKIYLHLLSMSEKNILLQKVRPNKIFINH